MIKCGIIGGAGYTAGELIRLLLNHPDAELTFINSSSNAGNKITDVHGGLYGETDLVFTSELPLDSIDLLFFCTAHGATKKLMERHTVHENVKIIDLSMDNQIDTATGTVKLKAEFANEDHTLFPNQFVNARLLVTVLPRAVTVPTAAVQLGSRGSYVNEVDKATVRQREEPPGLRTDNQTAGARRPAWRPRA